jgi:hypothetical protein
MTTILHDFSSSVETGLRLLAQNAPQDFACRRFRNLRHERRVAQPFYGRKLTVNLLNE